MRWFSALPQGVNYLVVVGFCVVTWPLVARLRIVDHFDRFSRSHASWHLDELAVFVLYALFCTGLSAVLHSVKLRSLIGERDAARRNAEYNAFHDALTGLPNRRCFQAGLEKLAAAGGARHVVALVDLDRFKPVNDLHGHTAGDLVLKEVANRLRIACPTAKQARLGGDEFALLFPASAPPDLAERELRHLLRLLRLPIAISDREVRIGGSIGATLCAAADLRQRAVDEADKALYEAKRLGRDRLTWYDGATDAHALERLALAADLRAAIDAGEIVPAYQPVIDIRTGRIAGFEALARWRHPERGLVDPAEFIPLAEETGTIGALDFAIMRRAFAEAARWDRALRLAVNISPGQICDETLVGRLEQLASETGFDLCRLEVEITEAALILDLTRAQGMIDLLHARGIAVALDDFGTGSSSLSSLRNLPFDRIKIDGSFLSDISKDTANQCIVIGIVSLARGLGLQIAVEGIESEADLRFVAEFDCDCAQGHHFGEAIAADEVAWFCDGWAEDGARPALHAAAGDRATGS